MKSAGVYVFAGGLEEEGPIYSADTTSGALVMTDGPYVETKEFLGGFAVVDVAVAKMALAVRAALRDAVLVDPHAPHAEGGAGTDAANRDLLVLRVIILIAHQQTGHGTHALGEIDAERIGAQIRARHAGDRGRDVERGHGDARGGDHHVGKLLGAGARRHGAQRGGEECGSRGAARRYCRIFTHAGHG